ncbi:hypothetical protein ASG25_19680 [Rhizobium sp. Leaf384]|uniref:hypothetical protein n=1 Tax=unclassified Rhizobium TaxID=2613769 RepID=UPI0007158E3C|nr:MULTISPECIES: hypothetical protein [unclassified Rhizobium]KQS75585.1 hypothetical protein ASG25_19680 [Rhizobium sp. Leaf384]KQS75834.1 hypothetical protein ASG58_13360 [Rhizobium sp. Leaf383]
MSAKSKLKFSLLAATAVLLINPGLVLKSLGNDDSDLRAQEMSWALPLPQGSAQGVTPGSATKLDALDPLLSPAGAASSPAVSGVNSAFAAPAAGTAPAADRVAVNPQAAPGDNPFLRNAASAPASQGRPAAAQPSAIVVPAALSAAPADAGRPGVSPTTVPASASAVVNPFAPTAAPAPAAGTTPPATAGSVDISALRYYASTRDLKRVGAELRRLKDLYPDWQPPKDLFTPASQFDEQPLWNIYATGNYAAVRAGIARAQSVNPKWQPSDDLLTKLQLGEARSLIDGAMAQSRWKDVISTAQAMPSLMVCGEMQVQWNVAEAFARLRSYADAFDVYRYILTTCDDPAMRLSTVQKASLLIPPVGFTSLLALGRTTQDGHPEFENLGFDGIRRQIGSFIEHGDFSEMPSNEEITRFVDFIQRNASVEDANLVGWYFYSQKDWANANGWFLQASRFKRDPKSIEGLILTLRQMDKTDDALKLARHYMKMSPDIARQYIEIVASDLTANKPTIAMDDTENALFQETVTAQKSALGAQAIGWKYLASNDKATAKTWFANSVEWKPTEGGVVGLAVLAARSKNGPALKALKVNYGKTFTALQDFKVYTPRYVAKKPTKARLKAASNKPKTLMDYLRSDS